MIDTELQIATQRQKIAELQQTVLLQSMEIERKDTEIKTLKEALRLVSGQPGLVKPENGSDDQGAQTSTTLGEENNSDETESESEEETPEAIWDGDLYYCSQCTLELEVDPEAGICACNACHIDYDFEEMRESLPDSCYTDNQAMSLDRSLVPRGDTPVLELDGLANDDLPFELPIDYRPKPCRKDEYLELRRRGATQLMCETFHLEFTHEEGIYAWADGDLYEEFAGENMQVGDFWKIHLGRRIVLEKEDLDGSMFIEGLLEDALLFPVFSCHRKSGKGKWQTLEESPGIWVTRLKAGQETFEDATDTLSEEEDDTTDAVPSKTDALADAPTVQENLLMRNEYDVSQDHREEAEAADDEDEDLEDEDQYDTETDSDAPLCECPRENMCLACMTKPDASWSDCSIDEFEDDTSRLSSGSDPIETDGSDVPF